MKTAKTANFSILFDVTDSNPNGDPDRDNSPRIDPVTLQGLVTGVSVKRKIRDIASEHFGKEIYVKPGDWLENTVAPYKNDHKNDVRSLAEAMCSDFFDIRAFGQVIALGKKAKKGSGPDAGKISGSYGVRGPIQLGFARSIDPVAIVRHSITRCVKQNKAESKNEGQESDGTFGDVKTVAYGLYRMEGYISATLAERTGLTEDDVDLFMEAMKVAFSESRSACRADIHLHGIHMWIHDNPLGSAKTWELQDRITVKKVNDEPRSYRDYSVSVDTGDLPEGITYRCVHETQLRDRNASGQVSPETKEALA